MGAAGRLLLTVARRIPPALSLFLAIAALSVIAAIAILVGRPDTAQRVGSATSALLNAAAGGDRAATFSAWSWERRRLGRWDGALRVAVVDWINQEPGHCESAWQSHVARGLIRPAS